MPALPIPLTERQIAATIMGQCIEWDERLEGKITFHLCGECRDIVKGGIKGGVRGAVKRAEEISKSDLHN